MALRAEGLNGAALAGNAWRDRMRTDGEAPTQGFARKLSKAGYQGLLVRSFAPEATDSDLNLVLWSWGEGPPSRLTPIDDEERLR